MMGDFKPTAVQSRNSLCLRLAVSLLGALLATATLLTGCGDSSHRDQERSGGGRDRVASETLALNWYAEAEHGGYVAAKDLGYFADNDLDVTLQQGGPGAPNLVIQELAAGRIRFAISNADLVVLARSRGVDVVAVAAPLQESPRCIMVHQSAGFTSLADIKDVQLAISDSRPFALWMKKKLPLTGVTLVPFSGQVGEFILNRDFAQQAYVFSEPFIAREKGSDPQALLLSEIGFNPYSSLLVTTDDVIREQPEVVSAMVRASAKGWKAYLADPTEVNMSIHRDNQEISLAALTYGAASMQSLCVPPKDVPLCGMTIERWAQLVEQIAELGEIEPGSVDPQACFTTRFLPENN